MKTLSLLSLAASAALLPTAAFAQAAGAGVSWQGGGMRAGGGMQMGGGMRAGGGVQMGGGMRGGARLTGPVPGVAHGGGGRWQGGSWSGGGAVGGGQWSGGWGGGARMPHFRPGQGFPHRLNRGGFVHPYWFGPQFYIQNWQGYGFSDPGPDRRWVRYYDDAYLVDRGGRVVDAREGLDWDQYGERWETSDGVPSYYGRNQFQPGEEDYAWVEEHGGERYADARGRGGDDDSDDDEDGDRRGGRHRDRDGRGHHDRDGHGHGGGEMHAYGAAGGGAAHGGGYAYGGPGPMGPGMVYGGGGNTVTQVYGGYGGYGMYAYPIVIETTTTTQSAGATYSEEVIEEVVETRHRARRRAPRCNCSRPRPPAGERG